MPAFECDRCGACCRSFPIGVSEDDAEREPLIRISALEMKPWLQTEDRKFQLYPLPFLGACPFLESGCHCRIYESRPSICRAFEPGSAQCQEARERCELKPLKELSRA